jgi:hypothetical protein
MPPIFRWVWLLIGAALLLTAVIWRAQLLRMQRAGEASAEDVSRFLRTVVGGGGLACAILLVLQLAAGWDNPSCAQMLPLSDRWALASRLVSLALWAATLGWLWLGDGAELISRLSPGLVRGYSGRTIPPRRLRHALTALVLLAAVGSALPRISPQPGEAAAEAHCAPGPGGVR